MHYHCPAVNILVHGTLHAAVRKAGCRCLLCDHALRALPVVARLCAGVLTQTGRTASVSGEAVVGRTRSLALAVCGGLLLYGRLLMCGGGRCEALGVDRARRHVLLCTAGVGGVACAPLRAPVALRTVCPYG